MNLDTEKIAIINDVADMHKENMENFLKKNLEYNEEFVLMLDNEIEMLRHFEYNDSTTKTKKDTHLRLQFLSYCFGKCLMQASEKESEWEIDKESGYLGIIFYSTDRIDTLKVAILTKVFKQYENGAEDSIYGLYKVVKEVLQSDNFEFDDNEIY